MKTSQLIKFHELLTTINQINGVTAPVTYFFITKDTVTLKQGLSLYDLTTFDFLMVIGDYKWKYGSYINNGSKLLGFFDRNLELIESIPVNDKIQIKGVEFTISPGSYYNKNKPIFICEKNDGERVELKLEGSEGWDKEFQGLYNQANKL
ncbi:MAG: hypothetical protein K2H16_01385 [Prevotella sp.]|nr:hypothetical protein [Prevotella sp.]